MLAFGLGTIPVMLITGAGLSMATIGLRKNLLRVAGIAVLVTGILTTVRGIAFAASRNVQSVTDACPLCEKSHLLLAPEL